MRIGISGRVCAMLGLLLATVSPAIADTPMRFGMDAAAAAKAKTNGLAMTYGSLWAGSWNQPEKYGWDGIRTQLLAAKAAGVAPVIQWWYWGDDISPSCVENGCTDRYQGVFKTKATWYRMSNELADLIVSTLGSGSGAIVIVETEFNKGGIETYEPFDGYLTDHEKIFHDRGIAAVISFGNWDSQDWPTFDRAAAGSDLMGTMILQSSVRNSTTYLTGADMLIAQAQQLQQMFGKPIFVTDFAFSSYPEPSYEYEQDTVVKDIFAKMPQLRAAGVRGMVWRMLVDDPTFDTNNYHGEAERHWGLMRADGSRKLAFTAFQNGIAAETAAPTVTATAPATLTATAGNGSVSLSWTASTNASSYNVKSSTTKGGPYQTVVAGTTGTTSVLSGLVNGVAYYFTVSANVSGVESANSPEASATPVAPAPAPAPIPAINVWWPTPNVAVAGTQPFKALLNNAPLSTYKMYWQVDGGQLNVMKDNYTDYPHKEASVYVGSWSWHGNGPYVVNFVVKSATTGAVLAQQPVTIYIAR